MSGANALQDSNSKVIETTFQPAFIAATSEARDSLRILHVDDDLCMLEISKQILMDLDISFEFDSACCVDEAFKKLSTGQYDVVISDYEMPQKNGLDFLKELREQKNNSAFIIFTGTGFGLFLTKKMIDVYGWKIEENGEPGIGAKFTITIPKLSKNGEENYQIVP
jgi:chemotaxis response regulator CheB